MLIRMAGAFAVISGCTMLGLYFAAREGFRINDLQELKKALIILSSEIEYMRNPLPEACANIARRISNPIGPLFGLFADLLTKNEGSTAYQLWSQAAEQSRDLAFLAEEDWEVVDGFGKTLGYLDKQMQQGAIKYALDYIDDKTTALQVMSDKNKRMYRSLGIIGGLLIAVVLW